MGSILRTTPMSKITLIAFILPMQLLFTNFSDFSIQSPLSQHFSGVHELETLYSLFVAPTQALAQCFLVRKQTDSLSHFHWLSLSRKLFTGSLTRKKKLNTANRDESDTQRILHIQDYPWEHNARVQEIPLLSSYSDWAQNRSRLFSSPFARVPFIECSLVSAGFSF